MKLFSRFRALLSAGFLGAALTIPASADPMPVKPEDGSKHFAAVTKHLDLGGLFFTYVDVDGDLNALGAIGDRFIELNRRNSPSIPESVSASKLIDALGLNCVKAVGMSSRGAGEGRYHNRALLYMPDGPKGIMKLFGGKAAPLRIPSFAPADAGMAMEMELTLGSLTETMEAIFMATTGSDEVAKAFKSNLAKPVPGLNLSAGELVAKMNTRVMLVASMDPNKKISIPGTPVNLPGIRMMATLDDVDFVMEPLLALLGENDNAEVEKGEGFTLIRPSAPMPGDLDFFSPALYHDQKNHRLILTTHEAMAKSAGTGATLGSTAEFKKAASGLPDEANGLTWVTPEFLKQFINFYVDLTKQTMRSGGAPANMDEIMEAAFKLFPIPAEPALSVRANVPDGMLFLSNTNENHKHTLVQTAVVPFAFIAGAIGGYSSAKARAADSLQAEIRRREMESDTPDRGAPAGTVKDNLQQIAFAAQSYFIDHPKAAEVSYAELVKAELIFDLDPVAGESYKDLKLKRKGGELSVKLRNGDEVAHKYKAAK